jgi:hypothetical protein
LLAAEPPIAPTKLSAQEALCGTARDATTSMNQAILPTVRNALPSGGQLLPENEWNSLSLETQNKLHTWFRLATERLQLILDEQPPIAESASEPSDNPPWKAQESSRDPMG